MAAVFPDCRVRLLLPFTEEREEFYRSGRAYTRSHSPKARPYLRPRWDHSSSGCRLGIEQPGRFAERLMTRAVRSSA